MVDAKITKWYQACLDSNAGKTSAREEGDEDLFSNKSSSHQPWMLMVDTKIISYADKTSTRDAGTYT